MGSKEGSRRMFRSDDLTGGRGDWHVVQLSEHCPRSAEG